MKKTILYTLFTLLIISSLTGICDDAVVLKYSTLIEVAEKKITKTVAVIIRINNPKGDKYTSFYLGYDDQNKLRKYNGEIRDINGNTIRKLATKDVSTSSRFDNITFYNDNFIKRFSLKHNKYPYIIEVSYEKESSPYLGIANWDPVYNIDLSTDTAELVVKLPVDFKYKTQRNSIAEPKVITTDKEKVLSWSSSYSKKKNDDILAPSIADNLPSVTIVPLNFNYIKPGSFESWKSYGEWQLSIDKGIDELTPEEKKNIDRITDGITDQRTIIGILYHYLQDNTRYVLVDIDLGGLKPYPATYVCTNRFGDCKALSNYMQALLRYKGIESNKIDVFAGDIGRKIYPDFPSQQFNHVILAVPLANDTIWLECTSNTTPVNYLGSFTQNRPVLWIEPNNSRIVNTPAMKYNEVKTISTYRFNFSEKDKLTTLSASFIFRGNLFEEITSVQKNRTEKEKRDYFNTLIQFKNYQSEEYKIESPDRDSCFIVFTTKGTSNSPFQTVGEYTKVDLPSMELPPFEKVQDRESDVNIYMPLAQTDTIIYDFAPSDITLKSEDKVVVENPFGTLDMDISATAGQLKVIRKYLIPSQTIPLSQYKSFYEFIADIKSKGGSVFIKTVNN
jgi:hypothetical protein